MSPKMSALCAWGVTIMLVQLVWMCLILHGDLPRGPFEGRVPLWRAIVGCGCMIGPSSFRSLEAMPKPKKAGRPKLPKGEAMDSAIHVRFTAEDTKGIVAAAKAGKQNVSEWIRSTIHAIMAPLADASAKMMAPRPDPPRISYPGTVEHLACVIREPDGTLKLGTNTGDLIELDANESNFLLVAMRRKPSEAKPS